MKDGLDAFRAACVKLKIDPVPLLVETCQWVDPETYKRLPVWYPETARNRPAYKKDWKEVYFNEKRRLQKLETNERASFSIWQALGYPGKKVLGDKVKNWTVCHIWGLDDPYFQKPNSIVQNPLYYSNIANMVLLPTPLKAFTDCMPDIKKMLRVCAWNLYSFICEDPEVEEDATWIKNGNKPEGYPSEWPTMPGEKPKVGVHSFSDKIAGCIEKRKREIKSSLHDPNLQGTAYDKEEVLSVLRKYPVQPADWWSFPE